MGFLEYYFETLTVLTVLLVGYILTFRFFWKKKSGPYSTPDWDYKLKCLWAKSRINQFQKRLSREKHLHWGWNREKPISLTTEKGFDSQSFLGFDENGNSLILRISRNRNRSAEVWLQLQLQNDKIYQLPIHPGTIVHYHSKNKWVANDLRFTILEPFKRLRICFNGFLKSVQSNEIVHVKFNFIWSACAQPLHWPTDVNSSLLSQSLALEKWKTGKWLETIIKAKDHGYDQYGSLFGQVFIKSMSHPINLNLPSFRYRRSGDSNNIRRSIDFKALCSNGLLFSIGAISYKNGLTNLKYGFLRNLKAQISPISFNNIELSKLNKIPTHFLLKFKIKNKLYECLIHLDITKVSSFHSGNPSNFENKIIPFDFLLLPLNENGRGIAIYGSEIQSDKEPIHINITHLIYSDHLSTPKLILTPNSSECHSPLIVGHKAASLALLSTVTDSDFHIPNGFTITVNGFKSYLASNQNIADIINLIELVSTNQRNGDLEEICANAVNLITYTPVDDLTKENVIQHLQDLISDENDMRVAVRLSYVYSISNNTATADQSVLNCTTIDEILQAICQCWAAVFSIENILHRRKFGQPINCEMGIIIQEMVKSNIAGLMYNRHPKTGNPGQIIINCKLKKQESATSCEESHVVLRNWKNELKILKEHLLDTDSSSHFLKEDELIRLANVGVTLQEKFDSPQIIEWAIVEDKIYLFQSQPINSLKHFTEFELLHEFDRHFLIKDDIPALDYEKCSNICSTLFMDTVFEAMVEADCRKYKCESYKYYSPNNFIYSHFLATDLIRAAFPLAGPKQHNFNRIALLSSFTGCKKIAKFAHTIAIQKYGVSKKIEIMKFIVSFIKELKKNHKNVNNVTELLKNFGMLYKIPEAVTSKALYQLIDKKKEILSKLFQYYNSSSNLAIWAQNACLLLILGHEKISQEHYDDFSKLLASCENIFLQEFFEQLQEIAVLIQKNNFDKLSEFEELKTSEILQWLNSNCPCATEKMNFFLEKYGFRGSQEMDLWAQTWNENPLDLLQYIKIAVTSPNTIEMVGKSIAPTPINIVSQLKTLKDEINKFLLKQLIPHVRSSIIINEEIKSALCSVIHSFRVAYRQLGILLYNEGRIPKPDMIFSFTHSEIRIFFKNKNGDLLEKVKKRYNSMEKWKDLRVENLTTNGLEKEHDWKSINCDSNFNIINGITVFPGILCGRTCVISDLLEANLIQMGDILVTKSINIGWLPYFPLLSGLILEDGGLLNIGAAAARHCGFPCIINASKATKKISMGQEVILNASAGFINVL